MAVQEYKNLRLRYEHIKSFDKPELVAVHDLVRDILDTRGLHLHKATSDSLDRYKEAHYRSAQTLDDLLIDTLTLLPHNIPGHQIVIQHPISGIDLYYQRYDQEAGHPVYVRFADWQPDEMVDQIIDRKAMLLTERSRSQQALEAIHDYEARGLSAVTEQETQRHETLDEELLKADGVLKVSSEPIDPYKE